MRSLLGLLAAHVNRPLSRDQVIEMLWPDADPTAGVNNLNQTVFQLRRELDPAHSEGEPVPYLVSTPDTVYLHPELVRTDFDELRRQAVKLGDASIARRRAAADAILDLCRGEFLYDLRYEDWVQSLQLRMHAELRALLGPLLLADGIELSHETGVRAACAALAIDEYDETAQFSLIRHLARSGKRKAARDAAHKYVDRLRADLDEEPGPELLTLMNSLPSPQ